MTAFLLALGWSVTATPAPALAAGPTTFTSTAAIDVPAAGSANQEGPASPYPSTIAVSGMTGVVTTVTVTLHDFTHGSVGDVDAMLVAPSGANLIFLSDVGDPGPGNPVTQLVLADDIDLTFADAAAAPVPRQLHLATGTYEPTNTDTGTADTFPGAAPAPSDETTLAGAFTGIDPNGTWSLYVVDDNSGDIGNIAGGWSLSVATQTAAVATQTTVVTSGTPSTTGDPVTFTATVTAGGSPVTTGTVQFSDGANDLGSAVAVNASGQASLSTTSLTEGTHRIEATYGGATGFLTSNGSVSQRVDNATVVTGNTFCNPGQLTVPSLGTAQPYPSNIFVSGLSGTITKVTATLKGLSHQSPGDLDILLSGPTPGANLFLLSDSGGNSPVSNLDVTFADDAAGGVPNPLVSGTFRPTNSDDGSGDVIASPAPAPSSATTLATFDGSSPNGQWSLWVVDDASGDAGEISGGWCLTVTTQSATSTSLTASPNPATIGQPVTFTATVTSGAVPVTDGSVTFHIDGTTVPVAVDRTTGTASYSTAALNIGTHTVTAEYGGTAAYLTSSSNTVQQTVRPVADAGGPYTVNEGDGVTLDASGSSPGLSYQWDLNGDGDFGDASGISPTLSWADLETLGIDDGPSTHDVAVRVSGSGQSVDSATTTLTVGNTAPTSVISGDLSATAGVPFTVKVGAHDPSPADMAAGFIYAIDWGDGSPAETLTGPADPPVTHTYTSAGAVDLSVTSTDKDGGAGTATSVQVQVSDAPVPTPTPTPTGSSGPTASPSSSPSSSASGILPVTGGDVEPGWLGLGAVLLIAGSTLLFLARRRRSASGPRR